MKQIPGYPLTIGVGLGKILKISKIDPQQFVNNDLPKKTILAFIEMPELYFIDRIAQREEIKGIILPECHQYSHLSGIVNYWEIPTLAIQDLTCLENGTDACIDSNNSVLLISQNPNDLQELSIVSKQWESFSAEIREQAKGPTYTLSGIRFNVFSEILDLESLKQAIFYDADGMGEIRSELVQSKSGIDTAFITNLLAEIVNSTTWNPIPVRFFDFGGEKTNPLFSMTPLETSPLGLRGIRILSKERERLLNIFQQFVQVVPENRLMITLPMITNSKEIKDFIDAFPISNGHLRIVAETPACVQELDEILPLVEHILIGPCDLTQYVYAFDRKIIDPTILPLDTLAPAVLSLVSEIVKKCDAASKPVSIFLKLKPTTALVKQLSEAGIRNIVVSARTIPYWKHIIRKTQ